MRWSALAVWLLGCGSSDGPPVAGVDDQVLDLAVVGSVDGKPTAVLIDQGKITALVSPTDPRVEGASRRLEAERITAGFVDAHAHPMGLGDQLAELDLTGIGTYEATLARVAAADGEGPLFGRGWDQNDWADAPDGGWPLAADLQRIAPDRAILLVRVDGHAIWVSEKVIADSKLSPETPDPEGGRVVRDDHGAPTGVMVDRASDLVTFDMEGPSPAQREERMREALALIAASGLTGVHDMGVTESSLAIYKKLDEAGELPVRIWAYLRSTSELAPQLMESGPWRGDRLAMVGFKVTADGALGSRGALLSEPYADDPNESGLAVTSAEELASFATRALAADLQVAVHAIGDLAVTHSLDAFEAARTAHPARDTLMRVEHAQVVRPEDLGRFAELRVVASMQPTHATSDMPWAGERLGPDRVLWSYSWKSLQDAGALLAFGSDFPVEGVSPSLGMWAATTRTDPKGAPEGGWQPGQILSAEDAVTAFTKGAAQAVGEEELGEIAVGMKADLTLWRDDRVFPGRWLPVGTVVGGDVVWSAP